MFEKSQTQVPVVRENNDEGMTSLTGHAYRACDPAIHGSGLADFLGQLSTAFSRIIMNGLHLYRSQTGIFEGVLKPGPHWKPIKFLQNVKSHDNGYMIENAGNTIQARRDSMPHTKKKSEEGRRGASSQHEYFLDTSFMWHTAKTDRMIFRVFYAFLRDSQDLLARVVWFNTPWLGHTEQDEPTKEGMLVYDSLTEARAHFFLCGEWEQVVPPPAAHPVR
ncbi:hypothetical protein HCDG_07967 [Histoplasma capsulatum H143]|uniref:Uncharacterized protein n=1 Tax=Ajellomyces capsulatus (strain H143) TaxID=544712 RepID=C6HP36_AJECH|nr:hypothetical protein HCDG_07967 [Histoplasma capsulatum H143]